jgi:hypothetical protein
MEGHFVQKGFPVWHRPSISCLFPSADATSTFNAWYQELLPSRGISAAMAKPLAADGFVVVVNKSGNTTPAEQLVHKIKGKGGRTLAAKSSWRAWPR